MIKTRLSLRALITLMLSAPLLPLSLSVRAEPALKNEQGSAHPAQGSLKDAHALEALHLLISHAELPHHKPSGRAWDPQEGAPDVMLRARYASSTRALYKSDVLKNTLRPQWLAGVLNLSLKQLEREGLLIELFDQDPLGAQHIATFSLRAPPQEHLGRLLSLESEHGVTLYFEWRPLSRYLEVINVTPGAQADQLRPTVSVERPLEAAHQREAQRLYRAYLSAHLNEDLLLAHELLLKLATRYAHTRYGLKAQRLLRNPQR